jgi:hypothetical protein
LPNLGILLWELKMADPDRALIPNDILKSALDEELAALGSTFREVVYENLGRGGIDLRGSDLRYSVSDLREQLSLLIGKEPADLLLERLTRNLNERRK